MKQPLNFTKPLKPNSGFTLVEVLVALLVLALAMTALQMRIGQYLDDAAYLRDKTIALWVAQDQLTLLQLAARLGQARPEATQTGSVNMAGRTWYWEVQITPGEPDNALQLVTPVVIQVSAISAVAARENPLISLNGVTDAAFSL